MRPYRYSLLVAAVIVAGLGLKLIFFNAPVAEADPLLVHTGAFDPSRSDQNRANLPVQKLHDMSFVFSDGD
jgi:hypothetical protein